jgi:hypothetical protein
MDDIEKSDHMICNTKSLLTFEHKKTNDQLFYQQMGNTQRVHLRDVEREYSLLTDSLNPKLYVCNNSIDSRGGNAISCDRAGICQGYNCYNAYHMNDYLLIPCKENTFVNYVDCDNNKCCSVRHQMFMNITKRR